ncbi:hypothetical protein BH11PSE11_BH11PSE11_01660 [soil metagenome]
MHSDAAMLSRSLGIVHADSPWRRLKWTGPLAFACWLLGAWAIAQFILQKPHLPPSERPIDARLIELPPPDMPVRPPAPARAVQHTNKPSARSQALPSPEVSPKPRETDAPSIEKTAGPAPGVADSTPGPAAEESSSQGLAGTPSPSPPAASPSVITDLRRHLNGRPAHSVLEAQVGVVDRPLDLPVAVEERRFDYNGLSKGEGLAGLMQQVSEGCEGIPAWQCELPRFSQEPKPWCYNGSLDVGWQTGTCREEFERATAAFKRKDFAAAFAQFEQLAAKDYAPAQASLAAMFADGLGVARDEAQAFEWWQKAARGGSVKAMYNVGLMYREGKSVKQDERQAAYWFTRAAYYGYGVAQYNLGVMYALGAGVPQDDKRAAYWYEKSAERGTSVAQFNLGVMYADGRGVQKDTKKAVYWYCKGVHRAEAKSILSVAAIYAPDSDMPAEDELAYFCWLIASNKRTPQLAFEDGDVHEVKLANDQIARARKLADVWRTQ